MKNILLIILLLTFMACHKHDANPVKPCVKFNYILAGDSSKCLIYKSFNPPLQANMYGPWLQVDLIGDTSKDIAFMAPQSACKCYWLANYNNKKNNIDISIQNLSYIENASNTLTTCGFIKGYKINDTIRNTSEWTTSKDSISQSGITLNRAGYNLNLNLTCPYIGFRYTANKDTLYGWLHVGVVNKENIVVYDCAYQKQ
jgi:hypothetical protein